jgi:hypothetical protein
MTIIIVLWWGGQRLGESLELMLGVLREKHAIQRGI